MKHLIIYHAHCNDGFGAAWAAWKALRITGEVELFAASYGKEPPYEKLNTSINVHIVDFSYPPHQFITLCEISESVTMLDHHKTAIDLYDNYKADGALPTNCIIRFDLTRSGAQLAWDYYHSGRLAPRIIAHIQDRDLWKFELDNTREVHLNLSTIPQELPIWDELIANCDRSGFEYKKFVAAGEAIQRYYSNLIQNILATNKRDIWIDGIKGLSCNCPGALASDLGNILATESGTFGYTFEMLKDGNAKCSLRSNGDFDVSSIARSFGGGGHKNAAGFVISDFVTLATRIVDKDPSK